MIKKCKIKVFPHDQKYNSLQLIEQVKLKIDITYYLLAQELVEL